jgi:hypothetical protein
VNRIEGFDTSSFGEGDRAYAATEMHALLMSALRPLRWVVNRPCTRGLSGPRLSVLEWRRLASRSALPVVPFPDPAIEGAARLSVTIVGGGSVTSAPEGLGRACVHLANLAGCSLLLCRFVSLDGAWSFSSADPVPQLDSDSITALADYLETLQ